jgi:hypothetical protein
LDEVAAGEPAERLGDMVEVGVEIVGEMSGG